MMLSMVGGMRKGAAKRIKPIVVRTPRRNPSGSLARAEDYVDAVGMVLSDLNSNDNKDDPGTAIRAILSMSWYITPDNSDMTAKNLLGLQQRLNVLLQAIADKKVFPITASGNNHDVSTIDRASINARTLGKIHQINILQTEVIGIPALYAHENPVNEDSGVKLIHIPSLLVVGAVDATTGNIWYEKAINKGTNVGNGLPHIYAPGASVDMANGNKKLWKSQDPGDASLYITDSGTSPGRSPCTIAPIHSYRRHSF